MHKLNNTQTFRESGMSVVSWAGPRIQAHYVVFFPLFFSQTNEFNLSDKRLKALMSKFNTTLNTKYEPYFFPLYAR